MKVTNLFVKRECSQVRPEIEHRERFTEYYTQTNALIVYHILV